MTSAGSATERYDRQIRQARRQIRRLERQRRARSHRGPGDRPAQPDSTAAASAADTGTLAADVDGLAQRLGAELGVAAVPLDGGPVETAGSLQSGSAWSTSKLLIALRVTEDAGGPGYLSSAQEDLIRRALTLSDNEAAASLFAELEQRHGGTAGASRALDQILRQGGDRTTTVSTQGRDGFSSYGQTEWRLAEQASFVAALANGQVGDAATARYILDLMGQVESDLWGLGALPGNNRWKGGWGPGTDGRYLDRQVGVIELPDGTSVAIAIAARAGDGTFESGQIAATELAQTASRALAG